MRYIPSEHPHNVRTRLTPAESQCLLHRLEVGDCIAEALEEYAKDRGTDGAAVEAKAEALACYVRSEQALPRLDPDDSLGREIMVEAVEGSTWIGSASPLRSKAVAHRMLESVGEKVRIWAARDSILIPRC